MTDQRSPVNMRGTRAGARGKDRKMYCRDCLFWYRCRLGQIDCEQKT